jgi:tRNA(fMet)-specific endonuclease VapC
MRFLLDTNIVSELMRHPHGRIADRIEKVGEQHICTSIIVAAELRYGVARKDSLRLTKQLESVLGAALRESNQAY